MLQFYSSTFRSHCRKSPRAHDLPFSFSVLDDVKNIKHLTLSKCLANKNEAISSFPTSQLSIETLVLSGIFNPDLHRWAMRWITRLTTLELSNLQLNLDCSAVFFQTHPLPEWIGPFYVNRLRSDLTGKRPLIRLCVTAEDRTPEGILGALKANDAIMDLVERNLVILKSEGTSVWGD